MSPLVKTRKEIIKIDSPSRPTGLCLSRMLISYCIGVDPAWSLVVEALMGSHPIKIGYVISYDLSQLKSVIKFN